MRAKCGPPILSHRLFGSHARGESDADSDIDVLLVVESPNIRVEDIARDLNLSSNADISIYTASRIEKMFAGGHLFAWHLYLESIPYSSDRREDWFKALGAPAAYLDDNSDIGEFLNTLEEAIVSFEAGENIVFEAGICHLACRNLGLFLSHAHCGRPDFSRYAAINLRSDAKLQLTKEAYDQLAMCRRISKRGLSPKGLCMATISESIQCVAAWATYLKDHQ
jgi:predicted nucleotidyltransferase